MTHVRTLRSNARGAPADEVLALALARLDSLALGVAVGVVAGAGVFAATVILLLKGGDPVGPNLALLSQFFPGYSVSWAGSLAGAAGGFVAGFAAGWGIACLRNLVLAGYASACAFWARLNRLLEGP